MQKPPRGTEFGALDRTATCYGDGTFPKYEDRFTLITRRMWMATSLNRHVHTIYAQLDGMCTSNGACETMMVERSFRGQPHVELAPEQLYYQHSKWGTGSTLDENLQALVDVGVCDRESIPKHARREDWPRDWEELAAKNRMLEFIDLNADFDAVATALQRGLPCLIGVRWPGGGGHAIAATELAKDGRDWVLRGPNSWGANWGDEGFYTLTERQCADFGSFGCWAAGSST